LAKGLAANSNSNMRSSSCSLAAAHCS